MTFDEVRAELETLSSPEAALSSQRFFKTGAGQYGEGDVFRGISVPMLRKLAARCADFEIAKQLLPSDFHEDRVLAVMILARLFASVSPSEQAKIYKFYLRNTRYINNWDIVDGSAGDIVGAYLIDKDRAPLYKLVASKNLWERRIAIVASGHFIRNNQFDDTLKLAALLLHDEHDLMHKATGWMLREVGKRDQAVLEKFLKTHYRNMPRTMLRYAIERFEEPLRLAYLRGTMQRLNR